VAVSRRSLRSRYALVLLVLASITLITLDFRGDLRGTIPRLQSAVRNVFNPIDAGVESALRPVGNFIEGAVRYGAVVQENNRLRAENGDLIRRFEEAQAASRQVSAILRQAHLPWVGSLATIPAEVVSSGQSNFELTLDIDKGTADGVAVGMPVVSGSGLLGRVIAASDHRSTVLLVTDPRSSVAVRIGATGPLGLASGEGAGKALQVGFVAGGEHISKGTEVFTSGMTGALFPPDLPVGTVIAVRSAASGLEQHVTVRPSPAAAAGEAMYVSVIEWEPAP